MIQPEATREVCARCRRPALVCWCAHVPALATRTQIVILQHPRESKMPVGTARMAHLGLPGSQLRVGIDFSRDPVLAAALAGPAPAYVVFPNERATNVSDLPPGQPITLVVIDGTWAQAKKLIKRNPLVAALPSIAFTPAQPSQYKIRREPADYCVSTIEALAAVLDVLEPDRGPFGRLLDPFHAMVARQIGFQEGVRSSRHRKPMGRIRRPATLAERLEVSWSRVVCVHGEANAWPTHHPAREDAETVQWTAWRPSTGATYEAIVAPRRGLAPLTPHHLELDETALRGGLSMTDWRKSWAAFVRPDDVFLSWGTFAPNLTFGGDLPAPARLVDVRTEAMYLLGRRVGSVEDFQEGQAIPPVYLGAQGRAGRRLSALAAVVRALWPEV